MLQAVLAKGVQADEGARTVQELGADRTDELVFCLLQSIGHDHFITEPSTLLSMPLSSVTIYYNP